MTAAAEACCPALLVSATSSGAGKTTLTAALARQAARQGLRVRVFKLGPDFLDPKILERASGAPVYQLDLWMAGEADCRMRLAAAAAASDLILVEGAMGLHDGSPSSAEFALRFGLPLLLIIDAAAMAQTFGAIAHGLATYRTGVEVSGVVANRVGSPRHAALLAESLPPGMRFLGHIGRETDAALPARHLGLVEAAEIADLDDRLDQMAASAEGLAWREALRPVRFAAEAPAIVPRMLAGVRIAVARDSAFSFLYPANLACLCELGASLAFFSPLADERLPDCDAVWLPGGYPELHLDCLSRSECTMRDLGAHHHAGRPILAECGGMLYLTQSLTARAGERRPMAGLVRGHAVMQERLASLDLQSVAFPEGELRGHSFHYSRLEDAGEPFAVGRPQRAGQGDPVYRRGRLTASYVHFYFPSCPAVVAALFRPDGN